MIKLPKEINRALQVIENAGYPAYAAGDAVYESLLGAEPDDWEILTEAPPETVLKLFERTAGDREDPERIYALAGEWELTVTCRKNAEEELKRRSFTVCAMADNPARSFLDPVNGRKDLNEKLIRTIAPPEEAFREDPALILKGIALAAELNFDIELGVFEAMKNASAGLEQLAAEDIREGFEALLTAKLPAKGLRFSVAAGIMPFVLGEECYPPKSRHEIDAFNTLMENYDMVRPEAEYRWPLLFLCFDEKKAERAIKRLQFDRQSEFRFISSLKKTQELYFIVKPFEFKKFLYLNGWENYEYWDTVVKQQRKVYDHQENRIMSRYYMKQEFEQYKMAIFLEDLAVDADDLRAAGIPEQKLDVLLEKLLYMVHYKPRLNTKEYLISEAKRYNKNPFVKFFRDVYFFK